MIEKLAQWLKAEVESHILSPPPYTSYMEAAEIIARELKSYPLPHGVLEKVRGYAASLLVSIMEIRLRKIIDELSLGRLPDKLTAEEERLVAPIEKILRAAPQRKRAQDYVVVQFLTPHPAIVTEDFVQIGPFSKGDLAKLPLRDAKDLVEKGIAKWFEKIWE